MRFSSKTRPQLFRTELANSVTHGIGLGLSLAGLAILLVLGSRLGGILPLVACAIYGVSLVLLYLTSTLFHSVREQDWPRLKRALLILDHSAVYLLIAGTYTPFALLALGGAPGWRLLALVWAIALVGIGFKLWWGDRYRVASVGAYLVMGWLFLPIVDVLVERIGGAGLAWVLVGAFAYCAGIVFYLWPGFRHHHAVWHLFVILGSAAHFVAVVFHVLPGSSAP